MENYTRDELVSIVQEVNRIMSHIEKKPKEEWDADDKRLIDIIESYMDRDDSKIMEELNHRLRGSNTITDDFSLRRVSKEDFHLLFSEDAEPQNMYGLYLLICNFSELDENLQIELMDKYSEDLSLQLLKRVSDQTQLKIIEKLDDKQILDLWEYLSENVQRQKFDIVVKSIDKENGYIETPEDIRSLKADLLGKLWKSTKKTICLEKFDSILDIAMGLEDSTERDTFASSIWNKVGANNDIQKKIIDIFKKISNSKNNQVLKENYISFFSNYVWKDLNVDLKRENIDEILHIIEDSLIAVDDRSKTISSIWKSTDMQIQTELISSIIAEFPAEYESIWKATNSRTKLSSFFEISDVVRKKYGDDKYKKFIKEFLGENVELDKENNLILPPDLKEIIFSEIKNPDKAKQIEELLPIIIEKWNKIKESITYKKANNMMQGKNEIRLTSITEIIEAANRVRRVEPKTMSAEEFEMTKGSEEVGVDTQYTNSPSTAVQRAHSLAEKQDKQRAQKKFPNFSVKSNDSNMQIRVLHPQDKSAILLGYQTHCCFRPNGNADNSANNEYSLLQYCLATPYGGVMRCESIDGSQIYMGTPILVNGNCLMLHSYETKKDSGRNVDEENRLLIEAAKIAIEKSQGTIDAVFMTDLHVGEETLHKDNTIVIPNFFKAYADGEYTKYEKMYTNLNSMNCILALRVRDRILTGQELLKWYAEECHNNPEELIEKAGLHLGKRDKDFDFGEKRVKNVIEVQEYDLVSAFLEKKNALDREREIISLLLQKKKLSGKSEVWKELQIIDEKLQQFSQVEIDRFSTQPVEKLRELIQDNYNRQLAIYNGDDIDLIIETYRIEDEVKKRAEEQNQSTKKGKSGLRDADKRAISATMAELKKVPKEKLDEINPDLRKKIVSHSLSDKEIEQLESLGIDVSLYRKAFVEPKKTVSINPTEKVQKALDEATKKNIAKAILFPEIEDTEVQGRVASILRLSFLNEARKKLALIRNGKSMQDLTEQEKERIEQELHVINVENLINAVVSGTVQKNEEQDLKELRDGELGIDLMKKYKELMADRDKLVRDVRNEKFDRLRANITVRNNIRAKSENDDEDNFAPN